jgi:hypothetical protein
MLIILNKVTLICIKNNKSHLYHVRVLHRKNKILFHTLFRIFYSIQPIYKKYIFFSYH